MKTKAAKIVILVVFIFSIVCVSGCISSKCGGMKYHNADVKRGLAH